MKCWRCPPAAITIGWIDLRAECRERYRQLTERIRLAHERSNQVYGAPKIHKDLVAEGETCSKPRVARLMRKARIQSKLRRKFVVTTDSKSITQPAPDLLQKMFSTNHPNRACVSDTSFIATREGWLYLAVMLDLYSRQVIGWSMSDRNNTELVSDALDMAVKRRGRVSGAIVHSDQGNTYASGRYRDLHEEKGLRCSMSRKGEFLDNAVAESFFGSLKNQLVHHED